MKRSQDLNARPPIIVAGNSPAAVAWAYRLGEIAPTLLVSPTETIQDPYGWAEPVVGKAGQPPWKVEALLPETDCIVGEVQRVNDVDVEVTVAKDATAYLRYSALLLVSSPTFRWGKGEPFSFEATARELEHGASVAFVGADSPAVSFLLELLIRSGGVKDARGAVTWMAAPERALPSNWEGVARRFGAATENAGGDAGRFDTIVTVKREPFLPTARESNLLHSPRVFFLDAEDLRDPGGVLYTDLLTCVLATGRYPLSLKGRSHSPVTRTPRVYLTKEARRKVWTSGSLIAGMHLRSLESHVNDVDRLLCRLLKEEVVH